MCVYWFTGLSLACYFENIRVIHVVDENILPNSAYWQENDFVFSSEFEEIALQKITTQPPPPPPNTHTHTFRMIGFQYLGQRERVHRSFIKQ